MPKVGMEPIRRKALIDATIAEVGAAGSLDVTVGQIARRAGMSSALAHHYFGGKDQILLAAMRHILSIFGAHVRQETAQAKSPLDRLRAIIAASFHPQNFADEVVAAWLTFYLQAQTSPDAKRLLTVYVRRLHSNLVYNLRPLVPADRIETIAHGIAALIDGFYIRNALQDGTPSRDQAIAVVEDYLDLQISRSHASDAGGHP